MDALSFKATPITLERLLDVYKRQPTEEEAIKILEGLQYKYNKFHNVTYRKDALEYAVRASAKYISNRCLPCLIYTSNTALCFRYSNA